MIRSAIFIALEQVNNWIRRRTKANWYFHCWWWAAPLKMESASIRPLDHRLIWNWWWAIAWMVSGAFRIFQAPAAKIFWNPKFECSNFYLPPLILLHPYYSPEFRLFQYHWIVRLNSKSFWSSKGANRQKFGGSRFRSTFYFSLSFSTPRAFQKSACFDWIVCCPNSLSYYRERQILVPFHC